MIDALAIREMSKISQRVRSWNLFLPALLFWTAQTNVCCRILADIISTVEFDHTGNYLATGDKGGRVVLFERNETVATPRLSLWTGLF